MLCNGGVIVARTDTLYGILGRADNPRTVARIARLKSRSAGKPFIVLLARKRDLKDFGVMLTPTVRRAIVQYWPGPNTLICDVPKTAYTHIHQGVSSIAFRVPNDAALVRLLKKTGPLVAPSANLEGKDPVKTIAEAWEYFGNKIDGYVDGGRARAKRPSRIFKVSDSDLKRLR